MEFELGKLTIFFNATINLILAIISPQLIIIMMMNIFNKDREKQHVKKTE